MDGKGKNEKDGIGKGKVEPCYFFTETDEARNKGQQCTRYRRMLKPEKKRCYICGRTKHMAGECDKPKKDDPPAKGTPKGDKGGKSDKGKAKGKRADAGKGKQQEKQVGEMKQKLHQ